MAWFINQVVCSWSLAHGSYRAVRSGSALPVILALMALVRDSRMKASAALSVWERFDALHGTTLPEPTEADRLRYKATVLILHRIMGDQEPTPWRVDLPEMSEEEWAIIMADTPEDWQEE